MNEKYTVIVGLGKTGFSCAKFCLRENKLFAVTDSRDNPPYAAELKAIAPQVKMVFGQLDEALILSAEKIIISPGVSLKEPVLQKAIAQGISYVGDIELFVERIQAPICAITGANAKSTVTTLVGEMAKASGLKTQVAGNIGTPVLDLLTEPVSDLYVLELSSFQLETTFSLKAKAATILNVSEDHMDRYASMDEYRAAKLRIYDHCEIAVINRADPRIAPADKNIKTISFGLSPSARGYGFEKIREEYYLTRNGAPILNIKEMKMVGKHNAENALAALALGEALSLDQAAMLNTLRTFPGLPHRCEFVAETEGVAFYNDSKGTNVGATIAALEGLGQEKNILWIAGGRGKGADFTPLRESVRKQVRCAILLGEDAEKLSAALKGCCSIIQVDSMEEAVQYAKREATAGDLVLLSPACASLDMFDNYEHRGAVFKRCVLE